MVRPLGKGTGLFPPALPTGTIFPAHPTCPACTRLLQARLAPHRFGLLVSEAALSPSRKKALKAAKWQGLQPHEHAEGGAKMVRGRIGGTLEHGMFGIWRCRRKATYDPDNLFRFGYQLVTP